MVVLLSGRGFPSCSGQPFHLFLQHEAHAQLPTRSGDAAQLPLHRGNAPAKVAFTNTTRIFINDFLTRRLLLDQDADPADPRLINYSCFLSQKSDSLENRGWLFTANGCSDV